MELTKADTKKAKGIAILGMVMLHLFCRLGDLPYTPWIWIGKTPLVYYLGLFGDICVPIYCFCSGYAHYLLNEKNKFVYKNGIPKNLLRFLTNYWIVVALFSVIGLISGNVDTIPGSVPKLLGNIFLYRISYNGAWWFVVTYIFLCLLSPVLIKIAKHPHPSIPICISGVLYFVAYLFRFNFELTMPNAVLDWLWRQLILFGTSQFSYMLGMVCCKEQWISKLRRFSRYSEPFAVGKMRKIFLFCVLIAAFLGHCVVQSLIVAPLTAAATLAFLFGVKPVPVVDRFLLLIGNHSTNIWLVHMFFYHTMFEGFAFTPRFPVLILAFMFSVCLCASWFINQIARTVWNLIKLICR